jgi:hypothetical protein
MYDVEVVDDRTSTCLSKFVLLLHSDRVDRMAAPLLVCSLLQALCGMAPLVEPTAPRAESEPVVESAVRVS